MRTVASDGWALALLLLVLVPPASADSVEALSWSSGAPLALEGFVSVEARGGVAQVDDANARGTFELDLGNGTVTVSSLRRARLDAPPRLGEWGLPTESARSEEFKVRGTRLTLRLEGEPLQLTLVAGEEGVLRAEGLAAAAGRPVRLAREVAGYPADGLVPGDAYPMTPLPYVDWRWEAGWLFCGQYREAAEQGFPVLSEPRLRARGPVSLMVVGGAASFVDANGTLREVRLGNSQDSSSPSSGGVVVQRHTRLLFHGEARDASLAPAAGWGLAGPDVSWRLLGGLATERATGEWRDAQGAHPFRDAALRASGDLVLVPAGSGGVGPAGAEPYGATGDFETLSVAGVALARPSPRPDLVAPAAGATLVGLVLLALTKAGREALGKLVAPFYTRLAPGDALDHATRRRLYEMACAEPGIHLREVGRRTGLSWGTLRFHVRMLRKAGFLQLHRRGGHLHVYPAGVGPAAVSPVLHPVAQRILAALPEDGAPLDARRLQEKVGASRQLVGYHLKRLAEEGRVRVEGSRPTLVARVVAVARP